jgi:16S rRNA (guanine(966)-N(2))-methyltransferase RsmD
MGYEFLSRGCSEVFFIEMNRKHYDFINKVLDKLEVKNVRVINADVFQFVRRCKLRFDYVFADPPFDLKSFKKIPELVLNSGILKPEGLFVLEHSKNHSFTEFEGYSETRNYGKVNFSFFRIPEPTEIEH